MERLIGEGSKCQRVSGPRSEVSPSSARSRPNFELPEGLGGLPQPAQAP